MTNRELVQRKLELAREAAERLAVNANSAVVAGSLTTGIANQTSDADVYIFSDESRPSRQVLVKTDRIDIEYLDLNRVAAVVDHVLGFQLTKKSALTFPSEADLDLVVRLSMAEHVVSSPWLEKTAGQLRDHEDQLRRMCVSRWAIVIVGEVEDFLGMLAEGDLDSAALLGSGLVTAAAKAVCAAAGDLYVGRKWLIRQLRRSAPASFPRQTFHRLLSGEWIQEPDSGHRDILAFVQTCVSTALLVSWQSSQLERWPSWERGAGPLFRRPEYTPLRFDNGALLNHELHRQVALSTDALLVWTLCNGAGHEDVVARALELASVDPAFDRLDDTRCRQLIDLLIDLELVSVGEHPSLL